MFKQRLQQLKQAITTPKIARELTHALHGIERETLRVTEHGQLALTPHPKALGSALTHPKITTDYSESLLEFITDTHHAHTALFDELLHVHAITAQSLSHEMMWAGSMPCLLPADEQIPIAYYGRSNSAEMKHVYRRGLALRYGKPMQCIAGLHYNFSFPEQLWYILDPSATNLQQAQSQGYVHLIRNFMRYSWLLLYCFGASPALHQHFLSQRPHQLETLAPDTLFLPYATSLRMSDLGYQNDTQASIRPCYNSLEEYITTLRQALAQTLPRYEEIGLYQGGQRVQLNTHLLQIENEYYASIRPKRVTLAGERPLTALQKRGIQYVEARCLDIDPLSPLGISSETAHFMDVFLWYCVLEGSPNLSATGYCTQSKENFLNVAKQGRQPGLLLQSGNDLVPLKDWARGLLDRMMACAEMLDSTHGVTHFSKSVEAQLDKVMQPETTPSAQVLERIKASGGSFSEWTLSQSETHHQYLLNVQVPHAQEWERMALHSMSQQTALESQQQVSFDEFIDTYNQS